MSLTGSIVIYICIWWIIFFASLPIGISHKNKKFEDTIAGADPGSPKNPKIGRFEPLGAPEGGQKSKLG